MVMNTSARTRPPSEDTRRNIGVTTFIETTSGSFKPIEECSKGEIAGEVMALLAQAESAMNEPERSESPVSEKLIRSLLYEAKVLTDYLNV